MKKLASVLTAVAVAILLPGSFSWADHAPSKRKSDAAASDKVKARLVQLGMADSAASKQVAAMTSKEIAYFAEDPSRVQLVGGLWGEEWVLGGGFLGAIILTGLSLWIRAKE